MTTTTGAFYPPAAPLPPTLEQQMHAMCGEVSRMSDYMRNTPCSTPIEALVMVAQMLVSRTQTAMQVRMTESLNGLRGQVDEMLKLRNEAQTAMRDIFAARTAVKQECADPIDSDDKPPVAKRPRGRPPKKHLVALAMHESSPQPCHEDAPSTPLPPTLLPNSPVY